MKIMNIKSSPNDREPEEFLQMNAAGIASQCGFSDAYYFTRLFTKNYGVSPSKYRIAKREEQ